MIMTRLSMTSLVWAAIAILLPAAPALAYPAPQGVAPDLAKAAGVYKHRFQNGDVQGDAYQSEDILELVPLSPRTAYFRIHTEFFNGHECNLSGVADLMADALTYFGPANADAQGHPCTLKFRATEAGLTMEDVTGACQLSSCGARGSYGDGTEVEWRFTMRRPIRYMPRLKASHEFADAMKEHAAHPVGTAAPQ